MSNDTISPPPLIILQRHEWGTWKNNSSETETVVRFRERPGVVRSMMKITRYKFRKGKYKQNTLSSTTALLRSHSLARRLSITVFYNCLQK